MPDKDTERGNRFASLREVRDVLGRMTVAEHTARSAELDVYDLGHRARQLGASWKEIADSVGITQQAAHSRWARARDDLKIERQRRLVARLQEMVFGRIAMEANFEYERRFLVDPTDVSPLIEGASGYRIEQAYVWKGDTVAIRVRRTKAFGDERTGPDPLPTLTMKGPRNTLGARVEIDTRLPVPLVDSVFKEAKHLIRKDRYVVHEDGRTFDLDVFHDANEGLVIAEFESTPEEVARLRKPTWCGPEVTGDPRYNNEELAFKPWRTWGQGGAQSAS